MLGHDEQGDALDARRSPFDTGQHQMDDVLGHVMFAAGDPDLLAGDAIGAIGLGHGLGAQEAQIGAAVRLGQVHGPAPLTGGQFGKVERLLLL